MSSLTQRDSYERLTKHQAGYVDRARAGECCADCSMYGLTSCDLVEGAIEPEGWCRRFAAIQSANRRTRY